MLLPRQGSTLRISRNCYAVCNYGFVKFQAAGYQAGLCRLEYLATTYLEICTQCIAASMDSNSTETAADSLLDIIGSNFLANVFSYCSSSSTAASAASTTQVVKRASSAPAVPTSITTSAVQDTTTMLLSGLVPCPSRILNPTYTPSTPLPSTYLWGCPPGKICSPVQINCNFALNPADTYVCAPDYCQTPDSLPTFNDDVARWNQPNYTIRAVAVAGNLMNLLPTAFGLNFDIFDVDGQPVIGATQTSPSSSSTSAGSQTSASTTTSLTSSSTSTSTSSQQPVSYAGAKLAGTIVGPILAILIALILLILFMRRRQKRRRLVAEAADEARNAKPQLDATEAEIRRKELSGVHINEVSTDNPREELLGNSVAELGPHMDPAELDSAVEHPLLNSTKPPKQIRRKPLQKAVTCPLLHENNDDTRSPEQIKRKPLPGGSQRSQPNS